ncbi:hypothetical protein [uncultured Kordia sp.]|uniref:hypothetical protein n=1 Tax=uncultured Kordia sp. TaxID=507699 RepID=UPI002639743C|nr:hypothetical protein [uncultured Kordia sp.]
MQFSATLEYFILIVVYALLSYDFLATIGFKKPLGKEKKSVQRFQQVLLILILLCMILYYRSATITTVQLSIVPWIWGFLAGHIFIKTKKRWLNELLGLGILLAITIVLFFKQTEIIQSFTTTDIATITSTIYLLYINLGFLLGIFLWPSTSDT